MRDQLAELARTPYFRASLNTHLHQLREVVDSLLRKYSEIPPGVSRNIAAEIWSASRFLAGSISKEIPYEVAYSLESALNDWLPNPARPYAITTALLDEPQYYFRAINDQFYDTVDAYLDVAFEVKLIQIALPRLYRHRPLYGVALYHELGHFVDLHFRVTDYSLLLSPPNLPPDNQALALEAARSWRQEFFADLFAAGYAGNAIGIFLDNFAPNAPDSQSHPSTTSRLECISTFLSGKSNHIIELFSNALQSLDLPELTIRYTKPEIGACFNNIRPYSIASSSELHGVLEAGWEFLQSIHSNKNPQWSDLNEEKTDRVINDLVEKSIRNWMVISKWRNGTAN